MKYFEEQRIPDKFTDGIDQFWQDTTNTFKIGANAVEADWNKYIEHLREITSPTTESKDRMEAGRNFFAGIPWSNTN